MPDVITAATTPLDALERAFDRAATYNERSRVAPSSGPSKKTSRRACSPASASGFHSCLRYGTTTLK